LKVSFAGNPPTDEAATSMRAQRICRQQADFRTGSKIGSLYVAAEVLYRLLDGVGLAVRHGGIGIHWVDGIVAALDRGIPAGGRSIEGVGVRIAQRLLAMTAAIWHDRATGQPRQDH
jgi:hypothetical protein